MASSKNPSRWCRKCHSIVLKNTDFHGSSADRPVRQIVGTQNAHFTQYPALSEYTQEHCRILRTNKARQDVSPYHVIHTRSVESRNKIQSLSLFHCSRHSRGPLSRREGIPGLRLFPFLPSTGPKAHNLHHGFQLLPSQSSQAQLDQSRRDDGLGDS